jgi:hypothetical protein
LYYNGLASILKANEDEWKENNELVSRVEFEGGEGEKGGGKNTHSGQRKEDLNTKLSPSCLQRNG